MALKVTELYGVTPEVAAKLQGADLVNSDDLLDAVARPADRKALAAKLGMEERALLELGNRADLARIKGIGKEYSDLLEYAGVDTVVELATRSPGNLYAKLQSVAARFTFIHLPGREEVESWVSQAKSLERKLHY